MGARWPAKGVFGAAGAEGRASGGFDQVADAECVSLRFGDPVIACLEALFSRETAIVEIKL